MRDLWAVVKGGACAKRLAEYMEKKYRKEDGERKGEQGVFCVGCSWWMMGETNTYMEVLLERPGLELAQQYGNYSMLRPMTLCIKCYGFATAAASALGQRLYDARTCERVVDCKARTAMGTLYRIRDMRNERYLEHLRREERKFSLVDKNSVSEGKVRKTAMERWNVRGAGKEQVRLRSTLR